MVVKKICFPVLLLLLPIISVGQTYLTQNGHAEFTGHTPIFSFEGSTDSVSGGVNTADSTVRFRLPVKSLDTGNGKRNRDMMDVLKAEQYPYANMDPPSVLFYHMKDQIEIRIEDELKPAATSN